MFSYCMVEFSELRVASGVKAFPVSRRGDVETTILRNGVWAFPV